MNLLFKKLYPHNIGWEINSLFEDVLIKVHLPFIVWCTTYKFMTNDVYNTTQHIIIIEILYFVNVFMIDTITIIKEP